ncbi:MAG: 3-phosphoshikimate 1-carboxyvinyltransferase [Ruminococcaceae bacterium]|nr:3-phosphoshikimate 1-carboxyvinyltransferase [Oscillospiraceae bacterium]
MKISIEKSRAKGTVFVPPSKSMAHRLLICGALSEKSVISGVEFSEDILATIDCLKALGAKAEINENEVTIGGLLKNFKNTALLNCRESGSTLRFLLPLCLLQNGEKKLMGSGRLMQRPYAVYEKICSERNIAFLKREDSITVNGKLFGGEFTLSGEVSSQFISGLLFALPLLNSDSIINITGKLQSSSYLKLTFSALESFGIKIDYSDIKKIKAFGNQNYEDKTLSVEGDYSNAAFLDAFNILGGDVIVKGLNDNSLQGDRVYKELFEKLKEENAVISLADCPDLGPVLFSLAAFCNGAIFTDIARLRIKESDRIACMQQELAKFGVKSEADDDIIRIYRAELKTPTEPIFAHNDHRIAMAMSVLLSKTGGVLEGAESVSKSFPDFFEKISALNIKVSKNET